jgi:hypothetical protein
MKKRFVVIGHPDFDAPGVEGIEAASEWVKELTQMINQMAEKIKEEGLDKEAEEAAIKTIKAHRVIIRKGEF